jgi:hypothetical protein
LMCGASLSRSGAETKGHPDVILMSSWCHPHPQLIHQGAKAAKWSIPIMVAASCTTGAWGLLVWPYDSCKCRLHDPSTS